MKILVWFVRVGSICAHSGTSRISKSNVIPFGSVFDNVDCFLGDDPIHQIRSRIHTIPTI